MFKIGWIMVIVAGLIIGFNVVFAPAYNRRQIEDHPLVTLFSDGENLQRAYTFMPPLTGFEIFIYLVLIAGVLMIFFDRE